MKDWLYTHQKIQQGISYPKLKEGELPELRFKNLDQAKEALMQTVHEFIIFYKENPLAERNHGKFGLLNKEMWEIFQRKHITHHFEQFGIF